jgi:hypothetical protein
LATTLMVENAYSEDPMHCEETNSMDGTVPSAIGCVSLMRLEELPHEHAGAPTRLPDPAGLDGTSL